MFASREETLLEPAGELQGLWGCAFRLGVALNDTWSCPSVHQARFGGIISLACYCALNGATRHLFLSPPEKSHNKETAWITAIILKNKKFHLYHKIATRVELSKSFNLTVTLGMEMRQELTPFLLSTKG